MNRKHLVVFALVVLFVVAVGGASAQTGKPPVDAAPMNVQ